MNKAGVLDRPGRVQTERQFYPDIPNHLAEVPGDFADRNAEKLTRSGLLRPESQGLHRLKINFSVIRSVTRFQKFKRWNDIAGGTNCRVRRAFAI